MKVLFIIALATTIVCVTAEKHRSKRLSHIVCDDGFTNITTPFYYIANSTNWCSETIPAQLSDLGNIVYREECQRWLGGPLPDTVAAIQLAHCFEFSNATVAYRLGICCSDAGINLRCLAGSVTSPWNYVDSYTEFMGSLNYMINYESNPVACQTGEICQHVYTFHGADGVTNNYTMSKGCAARAECEAINAATCSDCTVAEPQCATCCTTSFCNYDYYVYYYTPAVCPTSAPTVWPCLSNPCLNGGYCETVNNGTVNGIDTYVYMCHCFVPWTGIQCAEYRQVCQSNPCLNGGTCYLSNDTHRYSCDCPPLYVGDYCEIPGNLTCNSSNPTYMTYIYPSYESPDNCSVLARRTDGHPEEVFTRTNFSLVDDYCIYYVYRKLPSVHAFVQGVDGQIKGDMYQFELAECDHGVTYTNKHQYDNIVMHMCCPTCLLSPCLNGGYCIQLKYDKHECICYYGFYGDICQYSNFSTTKPPTTGLSDEDPPSLTGL